MLILAGIRGTGAPEATRLEVYDTWPVGRGSVDSLTYAPFLRDYPAGSYRLYHK